MVGKKWKMLSKVIKTYNHALLKCPFIINCFTGFSVATIGDFAAQKYVYMKKNIAALEIPFETSEWDGTRAVEMGVIRACFITPFILFWFVFHVLKMFRKCYPFLAGIQLYSISFLEKHSDSFYIEFFWINWLDLLLLLL